MESVPLLVDADWLSRHLDDEKVRVVDATTYLDAQVSEAYYGLASGRRAFEESHISGAVFADLLHDLADTSAPTTFTVLESETFSERIRALGIDDDDHVVIYAQSDAHWATRLWWNFRLEGFDRASILDGGFAAWQDVGGPMQTGPAPDVRPGSFTARRRPGLLADKSQVLSTLGDADVALVNGLHPSYWDGSRRNYARPGRIPGSANVFFRDLFDADGSFVEPEATREQFEQAGALDATRKVVTYCGSGIAATALAFQLARLGRSDVAVYDGSMTEWSDDESLPLEVGRAPQGG